MGLSVRAYDNIAIGIGAVLGSITAGGALAAVTSTDAQTKKTGTAIAGIGLGTAAGLGALMLRSPTTRSFATLGALGFVSLPSLIITGMIQNNRDFDR